MIQIKKPDLKIISLSLKILIYFDWKFAKIMKNLFHTKIYRYTHVGGFENNR